jgi:hypothetical protein
MLEGLGIYFQKIPAGVCLGNVWPYRGGKSERGGYDNRIADLGCSVRVTP